MVDPQRDISEYLADAERQRPAPSSGSSRPTSTPTSSPGTSSWRRPPAPSSPTATSPSPTSPSSRWPTASASRWARSTLEIRHTPGHTPESISIVVYERPDAEPWARAHRRHAVHRRRRPPRPARPPSAGRADEPGPPTCTGRCTTSSSPCPTPPWSTRPTARARPAARTCPPRPSSTIGEQRATNYALAPMSEDAVRRGRHRGPGRGAAVLRLRRRRQPPRTRAPRRHRGPAALSPRRGPRAAHEAGAVLLDTRAPESFASGHLRGSINVGLDGRFAEYAGDIIRPGQEVVLLGEPGRGTEAKVRLARIGFDDVDRRGPRHRDGPGRPARAGHHRPPPPGRRGRDLARRGPRRAGRRRPQPRRGRRSAAPCPALVQPPAAPAARPPRRPRPPAPDRRLLRRRLPLVGGGLDACGPTAYATVADLIGGYGAWASGGEPVEVGCDLPG